MNPVHRRAAVSWAREDFRGSLRGVVRVVGTSHRPTSYSSVRPAEASLRQRLRELAQTRVAYGSRRPLILLRRGGPRASCMMARRVRRCDEGRWLKPRPRHRRRAAPAVRVHARRFGVAYEQWALDFIHDESATGAEVRVLRLNDVFRRECLALRVASRLTGAAVAASLATVIDARDDLPRAVQCDNATAFTPTSLDRRTFWNKLYRDFSRLDKPVDNSVVEAISGSVRCERPLQRWFASFEETAAEPER